MGGKGGRAEKAVKAEGWRKLICASKNVRN